MRPGGRAQGRIKAWGMAAAGMHVGGQLPVVRALLLQQPLFAPWLQQAVRMLARRMARCCHGHPRGSRQGPRRTLLRVPCFLGSKSGGYRKLSALAAAKLLMAAAAAARGGAQRLLGLCAAARPEGPCLSQQQRHAAVWAGASRGGGRRAEALRPVASSSSGYAHASGAPLAAQHCAPPLQPPDKSCWTDEGA